MIRLRHLVVVSALVRDFWIGFHDLLVAEEMRRAEELSRES